MKQLPALRRRTSVDKCSDIGIADGNHSIERRVHLSGLIGDSLVGLLFRNRVGFEQVLPARERYMFPNPPSVNLAAADHAVETVGRSARGEIGTLNIGFFNGGTGPDVPAMIKDFRRRHPGVRVGVSDVLPGLQSNALIDGALDVGFTRPLETPFDQLLFSEVLYQDPLVAVFPKGHPLARRVVSLKSLARERFVLVARESSPSLFGKILALCSGVGFSPRIVSTGAAWASVTMLVEAAEGIAILPSNLQHGASKNLVFCPLKNRKAAIGLVMAWAREREGPVLQAFLNLVREHRRLWPALRPAARSNVVRY